MSLPDTIEEAIPYRVRYFLNAAAKAGEELINDIVDCPACVASAGQYCLGCYGRRSVLCHSDRRVEATRWRKSHPKEWKRLKDQTFRRIVKGEPHGPIRTNTR